VSRYRLPRYGSTTAKPTKPALPPKAIWSVKLQHTNGRHAWYDSSTSRTQDEAVAKAVKRLSARIAHNAWLGTIGDYRVVYARPVATTYN